MSGRGVAPGLVPPSDLPFLPVCGSSSSSSSPLGSMTVLRPGLDGVTCRVSRLVVRPVPCSPLLVFPSSSIAMMPASSDTLISLSLMLCVSASPIIFAICSLAASSSRRIFSRLAGSLIRSYSNVLWLGGSISRIFSSVLSSAAHTTAAYLAHPLPSVVWNGLARRWPASVISIPLLLTYAIRLGECSSSMLNLTVRRPSLPFTSTVAVSGLRIMR